MNKQSNKNIFNKMTKAFKQEDPEHKKIENQLAHSEKSSRAWLECSPVCTKIVDLDFNLQYMSTAGIAGLGIDDVTKLYGHPYPFDFYPESFRKTMSGNLRKARDSGEIITQEAAVVDTHGNELWFHSTIVPVNDDDGNIDYLMVVSAETTERKRAEQESIRSARLLQNVINTSQDLIFVKDTQLRTMLCNEFFSRISGKERPEELYGKTDIENGWPAELVLGNPEKGIRGYQADDNDALQGKTVHIEAEPVKVNGEIKFFDTVKSPMRDDEGNIIGVLGVARDITARKEAEQQLKTLNNELELRVINRTTKLTVANDQLQEAALLSQQAADSKAAFLASMSHEIRTPMNGVLGIADLLATTQLNEQQQEYLHVIKGAGNTLLTVINDILDYSKIEAGKLELDPSPFKMTEFLDDMLAVYLLPPNTQTTFTVDCDQSIPKVLIGDTSRLNQILNNLLNNAFKFTEQGNVSLRLEVNKINTKHVTINFSVNDTGIGIEPKKLKILFNAFTQADQSTTRQYGGTGLGLAISQKLAALMGSEITVESKLGAGSSFCFNVKFDIEERLIKTKSITANPLDFSSLNVLVAEDNTVNQMVVMGMMKNIGVKATMVSNGEDAVALICNENESENFDLILMDCEMPTMDGYEATINIRQWESSHNSSETPIYALTAHALTEHVSRCQAIGMNGHLTKPININQLRNTFEQVSSM